MKSTFFTLFVTGLFVAFAFTPKIVVAQMEESYSSGYTTPTPSPTAYGSTTENDEDAHVASTTKGGELDELPESLPVAGATDQMVLMIFGGVFMLALAGVAKVKLSETID